MAPFGEEKFFGGGEFKMCPFCHSHFDNQKMEFQCENMKKGGTIKGIYDDIFKNDVTIDIMETLIKIEELREKLNTSKENENQENAA